jgi:hypothetical protein
VEREEVDRVPDGEIVGESEGNLFDEQAVIARALLVVGGGKPGETGRIIGAAEAVDLAGDG